MKILVEATFFKFQFITGIERHFFLQLEIFDKSKMFDKIYIVVTNPLPESYLNLITPYEIIKIDSNSAKAWSDIYSSYKFDILYSTFEPPVLLPDISVPVLYVLHDPGRYIYPDMMEQGTLNEHINNFENFITRKNFYVITVSESSRIDIIKLFPEIKHKVFVIYNFVSSQFLQSKMIPEAPSKSVKPQIFFLSIGRYIPTKNTLAVIKSFQLRSDYFKQFQLVILGRKGWYNEFDDYAEKKQTENVFLFDFVRDSNLSWLYKNCYGIVNASIYEGFGLPLIEASVSGCKRIFCSDIPVFKEILPSATCFFNPFNAEDIIQKVFTIPYDTKEFENSIHSKFSIDTSVNQFTSIAKTVLVNEAGYSIKA